MTWTAVWRKYPRVLVTALVIAVIVAAASVVSALGDPAPVTYYACVLNASPVQQRLGPYSSVFGQNGTLYNVNSNGPARCQRGDTPISWSQTGPMGDVGPSGVTGPSGPSGPAGPGVVTRSGHVKGSGTVIEAPDVAITTGPLHCYNLAFAAGTFEPGTSTIPVFMPINATVIKLTIGDVGDDGSQTTQVCFNTSAEFTYTVTGQP